MINDYDVQAALVAKLKADSDLISFLSSNDSSVDEIRELNWVGTDFIYPGVRVDSGTQTPMGPTALCHTLRSNLAFRIFVYSEKESSGQARNLAWYVREAMGDKSLNSVANGFTSLIMVCTAMPAPARTGENIWRGVLTFRTVLNGYTGTLPDG